MRLLMLAPLIAFGLASPASAAAAGEAAGDNSSSNQAQFCEGTYALCIKAPCSAIPTLDRLGNYEVYHALCSCDVVQGWSMGPGACQDRAPVEQKGRTYLISTYSNRYNDREKTLSCESPNTQWAWCYGAPCVVAEQDPKKAVCTCPVQKGPAKTLGGDCRPDACDRIWSAANPAGDALANDNFARHMKEHHPDWPANPPAQACPAAKPGAGESSSKP